MSTWAFHSSKITFPASTFVQHLHHPTRLSKITFDVSAFVQLSSYHHPTRGRTFQTMVKDLQQQTCKSQVKFKIKRHLRTGFCSTLFQNDSLCHDQTPSKHNTQTLQLCRNVQWHKPFYFLVNISTTCFLDRKHRLLSMWPDLIREVTN